MCGCADRTPEAACSTPTPSATARPASRTIVSLRRAVDLHSVGHAPASISSRSVPASCRTTGINVSSRRVPLLVEPQDAGRLATSPPPPEIFCGGPWSAYVVGRSVLTEQSTARPPLGPDPQEGARRARYPVSQPAPGPGGEESSSRPPRSSGDSAAPAGAAREAGFRLAVDHGRATVPAGEPGRPCTARRRRLLHQSARSSRHSNTPRAMSPSVLSSRSSSASTSTTGRQAGGTPPLS